MQTSHSGSVERPNENVMTNSDTGEKGERWTRRPPDSVERPTQKTHVQS
jgi:hypothetical protein